MSALPPGSYLALSHTTAENVPAEANDRAKAVYDNATARPYPRTHDEPRAFITGPTGFTAAVTAELTGQGRRPDRIRQLAPAPGE